MIRLSRSVLKREEVIGAPEKPGIKRELSPRSVSAIPDRRALARLVDDPDNPERLRLGEVDNGVAVVDVDYNWRIAHQLNSSIMTMAAASLPPAMLAC